MQLRGGQLVMGAVFVLGMALVSGVASVPGARYSAVPQEVPFSGSGSPPAPASCPFFWEYRVWQSISASTTKNSL